MLAVVFVLSFVTHVLSLVITLACLSDLKKIKKERKKIYTLLLPSCVLTPAWHTMIIEKTQINMHLSMHRQRILNQVKHH